MRPFFPHPVTSVLVFITWLVQGDPRSPGHLLLGVVLAWALPYVTRGLWEGRIRVQSVPRMLGYILLVIWDVFRSNMKVTWLILTQSQRLHPVLVKVPLSMRDTYGIATLAATISYTPGTVAVDVSADRTHLLVHVFHTHDPHGVVREIKDRYERRLLEIFPC